MRVSVETLKKMFIKNGFSQENAADLASDCCHVGYDFEEREEFETPVLEAIRTVFTLVGMDIPSDIQQWCLVGM